MKSLPVLLYVLIVSIPLMTTAQKQLAIVGSSTSACSGATEHDSCYVGRLNHYYNMQAPNDTAIDNGYAVPGYSCYKGMPSSYVSPYANLQPDVNHNITKALSFHPDVVLVNYPTNSYDSLRIDSILYCLRTIRDSSVKAGVPCFITTTQPRTSAPLFNNSTTKLKLAILKDSILAEFGYFAIDFYTGLINPADSSILYDSGDQTHMNNTGHDSLFHRVVAKNVFLATLPATFLQFNTVCRNKTDVITWTTAKEINVSYYEIQRSSDGIGFTGIGTVNASTTSGNSQYQYIDEQVLKGTSYYKIIIVDKDGKKHASPAMSVYINPGRLTIVKAFARSASQVAIIVQNNEPVNAEVQILNNMGMVIARTSLHIDGSGATLYLNTPLLSNGIYHVRLFTAKESLTSSFVKN